jgi:ribonuclease P protein subunit POP4
LNLSQSSDPVGIYESRIKGRQVLLENPAKESRTKKEREAKRKRAKRDAERKALGIIGRKEAKEKSIWKLEETQTKCVQSENDSYL